MDRRSVANMKLDRRLIERRGWISEEDLQRELDALPDVSGKAATDDEDSEPVAENSADAHPPEVAIGSAASIAQPEPVTQPATASPEFEAGSGPAGSDTPLN